VKKLIIFIISSLFVISCNSNKSGHFVNKSNLDPNEVNNLGLPKIEHDLDPNKIEISHFYDSLVDSTFLKYRLSDLDLKTLKQILSDPNPDPDDKADKVCGNISKKCQWCGKTFQVESKYITYRSTLNMFINPLVQIGMVFSTLFGLDSGVGDQLHVMCIKFRKGIRYECISDLTSSDFCSLKCEKESRN
jgi:hypothetical protein